MSKLKISTLILITFYLLIVGTLTAHINWYLSSKYGVLGRIISTTILIIIVGITWYLINKYYKK